MFGSTAEIINVEVAKENNLINLFDNNNSDNKKTVVKRTIIPHKAEYIKSLDDIRAIQDFYLSNGRYRD